MLSPDAVRALPLADFLKFLLPALAVTGVGTLAFLRKLIRARIIEDTPTSRIRSAAQGYVELFGFCEPYQGKAIKAQLSGQPCLWSRYTIERYKASRKGGGYWRRIGRGVSSQWFQISDGTGVCVVDPRGAEVTPLTREVWYGDSRWPAPGRRRTIRFGSNYRYTEERLHEKHPLYVLGNFRTVRVDREAAVASRAASLLARLKGNREHLVEVYDRDGDGEVDLQEWEVARRDARRVAEIKVAREDHSLALNLIGATGQRRRPFLIACKSQRDLARRYRVRSTIGAIAALAGGSASAWLLILRLSGA